MSTTQRPAVAVSGLSVRFGTDLALQDVTLHVPAGEFVAVIGPNGAGKTTLLRAIAGVLQPEAGAVQVDGWEAGRLSPRGRAQLMAVVPQVEGPPPGFTVAEAVLMGRMPHLHRIAPVGAADHDHADLAMHRARVAHLRDRLVETLSGGERQRVLIARALAQDARILLLDEPTAHLDIAVQLEIMDLLAELHRGGLTLVAALHDLNLAAQYCRLIVLLDRGRIAAAGPPEEVLTPVVLQRVYGAAVIIRPHPAGGRPHITVVGRRAALGAENPTAAVQQQRRRVVVAIDGPAGAGKSTVARSLARHLGFRYVNTGWMYRAVAREALRRGISLRDAAALAEIARTLRMEFQETEAGPAIFADGEEVTEAVGAPSVSEAASVVSAHAAVREALVERQRRLGADGGIVMEGRDIGTVVFPDAEVKLYVTAALEERVRRRLQELRKRGETVSVDEVRAAEEERDRRDRERVHSPLRVAPDATVVDTTGRSPEDVVKEVLAIYRRRTDVV